VYEVLYRYTPTYVWISRIIKLIVEIHNNERFATHTGPIHAH